jgi:hypothetical protein
LTFTNADPGLIAGASGILGSVICWLALRQRRIAVERTHAELGAMLGSHKADCAEKIEHLGRSIVVLELTVQNRDEAGKAGLTRSVRSQAMQLLRSGMPQDIAASTLGIGRREMRLIAGVSRALSLR